MSPALAYNSGRATGSPGEPIRLMIVDDSVVARAVLTRMIEADGGFEIAAVAGTAEDAIEALGHVRVDVILLDLEMPGAGGLKSIPEIIRAARGARLLIVSSLAEEGAEATVAALALGADDTLPKPGTGRFNGRFSEVLAARLRALGNGDQPIFASAQVGDDEPVVAPGVLQAMPTGPLRLLALGASTGGIHALGSFFQALPRRIGAPILVTQHLPAPFMGVFARQLGIAADREALVAEDGLRLMPDRLIVAPGDASITLDVSGGHLIVRLDPNRSPSGFLPSLDPMFASAAALLGRQALGIVFSGIGRDGLEGAMALVVNGGGVLVQDRQTSAVWGMPRAVAEAGLACGAHSPAELAHRVACRVEEA